MIRRIRILANNCFCDVCSYRWVSIATKIPSCCANLECRSREWNGKKVRTIKPSERIALPKAPKYRKSEVNDES